MVRVLGPTRVFTMPSPYYLVERGYFFVPHKYPSGGGWEAWRRVTIGVAFSFFAKYFLAGKALLE